MTLLIIFFTIFTYVLADIYGLKKWRFLVFPLTSLFGLLTIPLVIVSIPLLILLCLIVIFINSFDYTQELGVAAAQYLIYKYNQSLQLYIKFYGFLIRK